MKESITFLVTKEFKNALENYCNDRNLTMSGFIKGLVADKLIEKKYLKEENKWVVEIIHFSTKKN